MRKLIKNSMNNIIMQRIIILILCISFFMLNINIFSDNVLFYFIYKNNIKEIEMILSTDVDVNMVDKDGNSLLHYAAKYDRKEILKLLLNQENINLNIKNNNLQTPLHFAAKYNREYIAKILIFKGANYSLKDKYSRTPIFYSTSIDFTKYLLRFNSDLFIEDINGNNLALYSIETDNYEKALFLIKNGIDGSQTNDYGRNLLHICKKSNYIEEFIKYGANPNKKDVLGMIPAFYMVFRGDYQSLNRVLKYIDDINITELNNRSLLFYAVRGRKIKCIEVLLENSIDIEIEDKEGISAIDIAKENKDNYILKLLNQDEIEIVEKEEKDEDSDVNQEEIDQMLGKDEIIEEDRLDDDEDGLIIIEI